LWLKRENKSSKHSKTSFIENICDLFISNGVDKPWKCSNAETERRKSCDFVYL
jgi:hypothetical protein